MPRKRTGTVYKHELPDGSWHWDVRVTLNDGSRSRPVCLPAGTSEEKARETALLMTQKAQTRNVSREPKRGKSDGETLSQWTERWFEQRQQRGYSAWREDRGRAGKWILPQLGSHPIKDITTLQLEGFVQYLDKSVLEHKLAWKSAMNIWGLVSKMFDDACNSKSLELRVLSANPADKVRAPDRGIRKSKAYLYPSEALQLITSEDVSLEWRRSVALAIYLFPRAAELRALTWEDVDLKHGVVHIHRTSDREGTTKSTKTKTSRRFAIDPLLLPLLKAMHDESQEKGKLHRPSRRPPSRTHASSIDAQSKLGAR